MGKIVKFEVNEKAVSNNTVEKFIEALPINGRVSLLGFLKGCGLPKDNEKFISAIRKIRNGYAHDIYKSEKSLFEIIRERPDQSEILKSISCIVEENYTEKEFLKFVEKDTRMLRFSILNETLRFLFLVHRVFFVSFDGAAK
ncbi:MAG: hypothetical protein ACI82H_001184 [Alphaproteobacteria bacterium]